MKEARFGGDIKKRGLKEHTHTDTHAHTHARARAPLLSERNHHSVITMNSRSAYACVFACELAFVREFQAKHYVVATVINARFVFMESISKQLFRKNQKTSSVWSFVAVVDVVKRGVLTPVSGICGHRNYRYYYRSYKGEQIP